MLHPLLSHPRRLGAYLLAWLLPTALLVAVPVLTYPPGWLEILLVAAPLAIIYAFVCLAAWYPCQATPPGTPVRRMLAVQLGAALASTAAWLLVGRGWSLLIGHWSPGVLVAYDRMLPLLALAGFFLYLLAAAGCYLHLAREAGHAAERQALEAQVAAREAELKALRAQMDPHFLFNSLNSVSALVGTDPQGARRMCEQLAGFLRGSLELDRAERIPLSKELALVHAFLQIERVRFGERLRFRLRGRRGGGGDRGAAAAAAAAGRERAEARHRALGRRRHGVGAGEAPWRHGVSGGREPRRSRSAAVAGRGAGARERAAAAADDLRRARAGGGRPEAAEVPRRAADPAGE